MAGLLTRRYSLRLMLNLAVLVGIAAYFWTQSRIPSLDDKALMGGGIVLEDPLSFEAAFRISQADPLWKRIGITTLNWLSTNQVGMTFGVFIGAGFLTLLRYLPRRAFRTGFANALLGFVTGAPLGVCVNCAVPIARGLYSGGARLESALAAMIASPTFNVVVLTMLFGLFPLYVVVMKLALTLIVILVAVPLICRRLPAAEIQVDTAGVSACIFEPEPGGAAREALPSALIGFARDYLRDLWFIIRVTVPLMVAAGFLGAVLGTLLPAQLLQGLSFNALTLLAVAVLGVVLPVPMAFDVILAAALLAGGVPIGFVMTLLFTLGIFSVYSFAIVAGSMSRRAAVHITVTILSLGFASGYAATVYERWEVERTLDFLDETADESGPGMSQIVVSGANSPQRAPVGIRVAAEHGGSGSTVHVARIPFARRSAPGPKPFSRIEAWHRGIDRPNLFSIADMKVPFIQSPGSIAAADLDNDGDADVVVADNHRGIDIFANDGSGQFQRTGLDLPELQASPVMVAAPVDLDNDGWLDLFVTTYLGGNYILWNERGRFESRSMQGVTNRPDAVLSQSVGFGDIDGDGDLDAVLGNYIGMPFSFSKDARDTNRILFNDAGVAFGDRSFDTEGVPGETLSILLSDFNHDGHLDLIEGNDFHEPDSFYLGTGTGGMLRIRSEDRVIPVSTHTTMSVKTADLDNDLRFEIYLSQISGRSSNLSDRLRLSRWRTYCAGIERDADRAACQVNVELRTWYPIGTFGMRLAMAKNCQELPSRAAAQCRAVVERDVAVLTKRPQRCKRIAPDQTRSRQLCEISAAATRDRINSELGRLPKDGERRLFVGPESFPHDIPQYYGGNVLLVDEGGGHYLDRAEEAGIDIGGWSWDVKIYDFDNDGLQDIHILNGDWRHRKVVPSNLFKRNLGGLRFEDATEAFGLVDYVIVAGSAAADFDNDGDIDEVSQTINGPLIAYWNNSQAGNSVAFEFRDHVGNRFGIGNKLTIVHGAEPGRRQIRELQLSGGYGSFDAPVMHFGLGAVEAVNRVEVEWSTGERSVIDGPFPANATYRIVRGAPGD